MKTDEQGRAIIPSKSELSELPPSGGEEWNRLVFEKSPYLLQHAANPVDWHPWGEEAFEMARASDKPVFLSVGYTTCHWCHVMEKESFEDEEVAKVLNEAFVCVKVDREERPDIDNVYMTVTQALTGQGGWPMTVVMTPDKRPFFAGTYFPKYGRQGRHGMMELVPGIARHWKEQREKILTSADEISKSVSQMSSGASGGDVSGELLTKAYEQLKGRFDEEDGGFGGVPKFPVPHNLSFLARYWGRTGDATALRMANRTLRKMRLGGVYDHVGYGFHRYSTDQYWLVPHFEKMLYDQAMMVLAYVDNYLATGEEEFATVAREVIAYVLRDLTAPDGGFFSAEDADSEGEEGKFYVWDPAEVLEILGEELGALFNDLFDIEEGGNYFDEASRAPTGSSIVHLHKAIEVIAEEKGLDETVLRERLEGAREKLFTAREKRIHPQKDDKILTDWNGLMIAALARAGRGLAEPAFVDAARKAGDFLLGTLLAENGRLHKRYRDGEVGLPAHLDDYAFSVWGLLELYESTFEVRYLEAAIGLNDTMLDHFWDADKGGLFLAADDGESLLVRSKAVFDNAYPSGNSAAALNLVRIARITGRPDYEAKANAVLEAFSKMVDEIPSAHTQLLAALDFLQGPSVEVVVAGETGAPDTEAMIAALNRLFLPAKAVVFRPVETEDPPICSIVPFARDQKAVDGKATAYICRNGACDRPVTSVEEMIEKLSELGPRGE